MVTTNKTKVIYRLPNEGKERQKTFKGKLNFEEIKSKLPSGAMIISVIRILPTIFVDDDIF